MNGIILRFTANKREVGILKSSKSSSQYKASLSNANKEDSKCKYDNNKTYLSLKFKCFEKYRNFDDSPYKKTLVKSDPDNKKNKSIRIGKDCPVRDVLTNNSDRKVTRSNTVLAKEGKKSLHTSGGKGPIKLKRSTSPRKSSSKFRLIPKAFREYINDLKHNSSEEESSRKHPNRRLQRERPECDLPVKRPRYSRFSKPKPKRVVVAVKREHPEPPFPESRLCSIGIKQEKEDKSEPEIKPIKVEKDETEDNKPVAKMWEQVLDSPHFEDEETEYIKQRYGTSDSETEDSEVDYTETLDEFVLEQEEECKYREKTLYEKRVDEMMRDPNCAGLVKEFYIPPALVESLFAKMVLDQTSEQSLRRVCAAKRWPKPQFTCIYEGKHGFLYSCTLKTKTFTPTRLASNEELAKELAAVECLEWLGFEQRSLGERSVRDTYFP